MSDLKEYLAQKRDAVLRRRAHARSEGAHPLRLQAQAQAEGRSGVRRIRIRGFQVISDSLPDFAGYDLGPSSPELLLGALSSCLTHLSHPGRRPADRAGGCFGRGSRSARSACRSARPRDHADLSARSVLHGEADDGCDRARCPPRRRRALLPDPQPASAGRRGARHRRAHSRQPRRGLTFPDPACRRDRSGKERP